MNTVSRRPAGDEATELAHSFFGSGFNSPFSFDPEKKQFCLGDNQVSPEDFNIWNPNIGDTALMPDELLANSAVVILVSGHLIQMPRMTKWLRELEGDSREAMFMEAGEVMKAVANQLGYEYMGNNTIGIHTSYDVIQTEAIVSGGELVVSPAATFFNQTSDWDSGFAGFEFHNVDTPQQEKILCAGLGTLASICIRETQPRSIT